MQEQIQPGLPGKTSPILLIRKRRAASSFALDNISKFLGWFNPSQRANGVVGEQRGEQRDER